MSELTSNQQEDFEKFKSKINGFDVKQLKKEYDKFRFPDNALERQQKTAIYNLLHPPIVPQTPQPINEAKIHAKLPIGLELVSETAAALPLPPAAKREVNFADMSDEEIWRYVGTVSYALFLNKQAQSNSEKKSEERLDGLQEFNKEIVDKMVEIQTTPKNPITSVTSEMSSGITEAKMEANAEEEYVYAKPKKNVAIEPAPTKRATRSADTQQGVPTKFNALNMAGIQVIDFAEIQTNYPLKINTKIKPVSGNKSSPPGAAKLSPPAATKSSSSAAAATTGPLYIGNISIGINASNPNLIEIKGTGVNPIGRIDTEALFIDYDNLMVASTEHIPTSLQNTIRSYFTDIKRYTEAAVRAGKSQTNFQSLNAAFNMADCEKDKTPISQLQNFQRGRGQFSSIVFRDAMLKNVMHAIKDSMIERGDIIRVIVARIDKGNEETFSHFENSSYNIAYDCGYLGFLKGNWYKITETFGKYIDPSSSRGADRCFPSGNQNLVLGTDVFKLLGYNGCAIQSAKNVGRDKYEYNIQIAGEPLTNESPVKDRKNDVNINNVFVGNTKKDTSNLTNVLGKSLGDKLQVFLQKINFEVNKQNSGDVFCVTTCDDVVLTFCILLNLPCFFTGVDKVELNGVQDVKVNEILYYNPEGSKFEHVQKRFSAEYASVYNKYDEYIKLLIFNTGKEVLLKDKRCLLTTEVATIFINDIMTIQKYMREFIYDEAIKIIPPVENDSEAAKTEKKIKIKMLNDFTSKSVNMYPNTIIKKTKNENGIFFQSVTSYYDYGENVDDLEILKDVICKTNIQTLFKNMNEETTRESYRTMSFMDIIKETDKYVKTPIKVGGGSVFDVQNNREYEYDYALDDILENAHIIDMSTMCQLDAMELSEHLTDENKSTVVVDESGRIVGIHEEVSTSFNVYEKLYEELYEIYTRIHEPVADLTARKFPIKFPFLDYLVTMVDCKLHKIRNYSTYVLNTEMLKLKNSFENNWYSNFGEIILDKQNHITNLNKSSQSESKNPTSASASAATSSEEEITNNILPLKTIIEIDNKVIASEKNAPEKLQIILSDPTSIMYNLSQDEDYGNDGIGNSFGKIFRKQIPEPADDAIKKPLVELDLDPYNPMYWGGRVSKTKKKTHIVRNRVTKRKNNSKNNRRKIGTKRRNKRGQKKHKTR